MIKLSSFYEVKVNVQMNEGQLTHIISFKYSADMIIAGKAFANK